MPASVGVQSDDVNYVRICAEQVGIAPDNVDIISATEDTNTVLITNTRRPQGRIFCSNDNIFDIVAPLYTSSSTLRQPPILIAARQACAAALSGDGLRAVTAHDPGVIRLWNLPPVSASSSGFLGAEEVTHVNRLFSFQHAVAWMSRAGDRSIVALADEVETEFFFLSWPVGTATPVTQIRRKLPARVHQIAISEQHDLAVSVQRDSNGISVCIQRCGELGTRNVIRSIAFIGSVPPFVSVARNVPVVAISTYGEIRVIDSLNSLDYNSVLTPGALSNLCALTDDGKLLICGGDTGIFRIWDVCNRQSVGLLNTPRHDPVTALIVSRSGTVLCAQGKYILKATLTGMANQDLPTPRAGFITPPTTTIQEVPPPPRVSEYQLPTEMVFNQLPFTYNPLFSQGIGLINNGQPPSNTQNMNPTTGSSIAGPSSHGPLFHGTDGITNTFTPRTTFPPRRLNSSNRRGASLNPQARTYVPQRNGGHSLVAGSSARTQSQSSNLASQASGSSSGLNAPRQLNAHAPSYTPLIRGSRVARTTPIMNPEQPSHVAESPANIFTLAVHVGSGFAVPDFGEDAAQLHNTQTFFDPLPRLIELEDNRAPLEFNPTMTASEIDSSVTRIRELLARLRSTNLSGTHPSKSQIQDFWKAKSACDIELMKETDKLGTVAKKLRGDQNSNEVTFCTICQDNVNSGDMVIRLPCDHVFHRDCMWNYILREDFPRCPICRAQLNKSFGAVLPLWKWQGDGTDLEFCREAVRNNRDLLTFDRLHNRTA